MLHLQLIVAVPARGAGCIVSMFDDFDIDYNQLPSPRGVRVASITYGAVKRYNSKLPSPRGVRVASRVSPADMFNCAKKLLPSP